jgi:hypothetical protein
LGEAFDMPMMGKSPAAASPDAYVQALTGWHRHCVEMLRAAINAGGDFSETIKWTNLLFVLNGPCIVIRAEEERVLLAFFRERGWHISIRALSRAGNMSSLTLSLPKLPKSKERR